MVLAQALSLQVFASDSLALEPQGDSTHVTYSVDTIKKENRLKKTINKYKNKVDSVKHVISTDEPASFPIRTIRWYKQNFGQDSSYVRKNKQKQRFAIRLISDNMFDFHSFSTLPNSEYDFSGQMKSDIRYKIGLALTVNSVSLSYSTDINNFSKLSYHEIQTFSFAINTSRITLSAEYFYDNGPKFCNSIKSNGKLYDLHDMKLDGFCLMNLDISANYIFNFRKYAANAAYTFSKVQLKPAGSFIAGISFVENENKINIDNIPDEITSLLPYSGDLKGKHNISNSDILINFGYGYNFVFLKHFLINTTIIPRIGLKYANTDHHYKYFVACDPIAQFAIVLNFDHFFLSLNSTGKFFWDFRDTKLNNDILLNFAVSAGTRF